MNEDLNEELIEYWWTEVPSMCQGWPWPVLKAVSFGLVCQRFVVMGALRAGTDL